MTKCSNKCKNECVKNNKSNKNNMNNINNNINNKRNTIPLKYVYYIIGVSIFIFISTLIFGIYYLYFHRKGYIKRSAELINEDECNLNKYQKCDYTIKIIIEGKEYIKKFHSNKELKITEIDGKNTIEIEYDPKNPKDTMELFINKDMIKIILSLILIVSLIFVVYFVVYKYFKIVKGINKIKLDHDFFI